jgi:hypothetical protein
MHMSTKYDFGLNVLHFSNSDAYNWIKQTIKLRHTIICVNEGRSLYLNILIRRILKHSVLAQTTR